MRDDHDHDQSDAPAVATGRYEAVATDPNPRRRDTARKIVGLVCLVFGIVEGLLGIRFILLALAANPDAGLAALIYGLTGPLMIPFTGLFETVRVDGSLLEWNAATAIIAYALLGWLLAGLVWLVSGQTRSEVHPRASRIDTDRR